MDDYFSKSDIAWMLLTSAGDTGRVPADTINDMVRRGMMERTGDALCLTELARLWLADHGYLRGTSDASLGDRRPP